MTRSGRREQIAPQDLPAPEITCHYNVKWRDGKEVKLVEIIARRLTRGRDARKSPLIEDDTADDLRNDLQDHNKMDFEGTQRVAGCYEYYVHWFGQDRRLDEWVTWERIDLLAGVQEAPPGSGEGADTKTRKRKLGEEGGLGRGWLDPGQAAVEKEHEEITKVKNIHRIALGRHDIETWYYSPFPQEYCNTEFLHVCEFCLKYMRKRRTLIRHYTKCHLRHPPGDEIYREGQLSVFEVDGKQNKIYCQNLCLLAKLFLDHKTLYYDVDPFLFYILCESDGKGYHIVGYFSKEKQSTEDYNLACILTFPPYQRCGYGKFLISLSYELTKLERKLGSPEKPLSDLGKLSYRSYWTLVLMRAIKDAPHKSVRELSQQAGMKVEDVISTLHYHGMIRYFKGQHAVFATMAQVDSYLAMEGKMRLCKPECLQWEGPPGALIKGKTLGSGMRKIRIPD